MAHPATVPDRTLQQAAAGDRRARAALLTAYGPLVYSVCRRLTPDADDAYQEVWVKALAALARFDVDGPASFKTWLLTITHRHLVDRHRRRRVRGEVVPLSELRAEATDAEGHLERHRRLARLDAALQALPEPQRRIVVLHHLHGVALTDIAAQEGVAVGTVKSRLHRARGRLATLLGGSR